MEFREDTTPLRANSYLGSCAWGASRSPTLLGALGSRLGDWFYS